MSDNEEPEPLPRNAAPVIGSVANIADPIRLTDVKIAGVSMSAALPDSTVAVARRMAMTSEDPQFHTIAEGLVGAIEHLAAVAGQPVSLSRADSILLVVHHDDTADLWVDTVATSVTVILKRSVQAGQPVFSNDIADVLGVRFPAVNILETDRVLYLFRQSWRFGLCFHFDNDPLDVDDFSRTLGFLYRAMTFRHLYEALETESVFKPMIDAGWFPFAEIMPLEVKTLISHCKAGFPLALAEAELISKFDAARMEHILERWKAKPTFGSKKKILESAIRAYCNEDPVSCIKIVITEIEGVLNNVYRERHGTGTRQINKLLDFAKEMATERIGSPSTLLFPVEFVRYMREYTYASFDPSTNDGAQNSRHAVGHGAANDDTYTQVRALQAILTLDQLAFYL